MRKLGRLAMLPVGLVALACGGRESAREAALSDELRADLAAAAAADLELASSVNSGDAQVMSAIERVKVSAPSRSAAPRRSPARRAVPRPQPEAVPEPTPIEDVADEPEMIAEAPAASDMPVATRPVPVAFPSGGGTSAGSRGGVDAGDVGEVVGAVIGVVIRGGGAGVDHCEIHDRRRRGRGTSAGSIGGILINSRIPVTGPQTFPRY